MGTSVKKGSLGNSLVCEILDENPLNKRPGRIAPTLAMTRAALLENTAVAENDTVFGTGVETSIPHRVSGFFSLPKNVIYCFSIVTS